jgi:large subunit ribosomal protein L23
MRDPYSIILRPRISEKAMTLSYGNPRLPEDEVTRKYTFLVAPDANKIEIKKAVEAIYNAGKKKSDDMIQVVKVNTISVKGKTRRNFKKPGKRSDYKKAIVTLAKGQVLEDFGV